MNETRLRIMSRPGGELVSEMGDKSCKGMKNFSILGMT